MLNNSIRGIRTANQNHELRMMDIKQRQAEFEAQQNDPRNRLAKLQAQQELEEVPVQYRVGSFDDDNERALFNRYTRPAIESVLQDEGMALSQDGRVVYAGTQKQAKVPRYLQRTLNNKLSLATMGSRLGHTQLDMDIENLRESIVADAKDLKKYGAAKELMMKSRLGVKQAQLDKLEAKRQSPEASLERLMTNNKTLSDMYMAALSDPNIDDAFYKRLNDARKLNNDEIANMLSTNANLGKNLVKVTYSNVADDGVVNKRDVYMSKFEAAKAPTEIDYGDGIYKLGEVSNVDKGSEGGAYKLPGGVTPSQAQSIYNRHAKAKNIVSAARQKDMGEEHVKSILMQDKDMTEAELNSLMLAIKTDAKDVIKTWEDVVKKDENLFGRYKWFQGGDFQTTPVSAGGFNPDAIRQQLEANRKK